MIKHQLPALQSISQADVGLYQQHIAEITILLNDFLLRYLNTVYQEFKGDIPLAIILGEIAHHTIANHVRKGRFSLGVSIEKAVEDIKNKKDIQACNPFSVSEATGIPRETVRRKFSELQKMGYIDKVSARAYVLNMKASDHFVPDFNLRLFEGFRILCTQMNEMFNGFETHDS